MPKRIRFDNLSPAVKKVLPHGKRELTEAFERFALHYSFAYEFCNPGAGNEKGHVEAMVKYVRNNFFLPERTVYSLEDLNNVLWDEVENDRYRPHYEKKEEIARLFEEDKEALLHLPPKEYSGIRYETLKADKYGYVLIDSRKYSTSPRYSSQRVLVGVTYNRIDILTDNHEVIVRHERLYGEKSKSMNWQPYLSLMAKRPTALKYTTFYNQLPDIWQKYLHECTVEEKKKALLLLSTILKNHRLQIATEALEIASEGCHPSSETIKQVFHQLVHGRGHRQTLKLKTKVPSMPSAERGMSRYDAFFTMEGGKGHAR